MTEVDALIDAIHNDRLPSVDHDEARRMCADIGRAVEAEVTRVVDALRRAGVDAQPVGDPGAPQARHGAVISVATVDTALVAADVLTADGFAIWEPTGGPGRLIHRRFDADVTVARTTDITFVLTIRPLAGRRRPIPTVLVPNRNDVDAVSLPDRLWPLYFAVRPVRLALERLGLRSRSSRSLGPFLSTPDALIDPLLELADIGEDDVVVDIGCGDGRILMAAVRTYGCRAVGVEADPDLAARARSNAEQLSNPARLRIVNDDAGGVLDQLAVEGTVFFVFVPAETAGRLVADVLDRARPGSVVIAHEQHRLVDPPTGARSVTILTPQGVTVAHRWQAG